MKMKNLMGASLVVISITTLLSCGGASTSTADAVVSKNSTAIVTKDGGSMMDHDTELTTGFMGLSVEQAYIVDGNDKKIVGDKVAPNSNFSIVYEGVKNYTLKDGKAFPKLSIQVIDDNQQLVLAKDDLLATAYPNGLSVSDASVLRATVTAGDPIKPGKYTCSVIVLDKNNGNASVQSSWSFEVK